MGRRTRFSGTDSRSV